MIMGSPLWKRGVRGDFVKIFNSIGVLPFREVKDWKESQTHREMHASQNKSFCPK
jgi:hypothetical protein